MTENKYINEHGIDGTFIVRIDHRQHSSWQGQVTWVQEQKTVQFRSVLELLKLIDKALEGQQMSAGSKETESNQESGGGHHEK